MAKYTDIDVYLTKNEITNDINIKTDVAAISQSIKNIILTTKGEKPFNPTFGGGLYDMVYNDVSLIQLRLKEGELRAILELYEPRARVQTLNITSSGTGSWIVEVVYSPVYDQSVTRDLTITVGNDT